MQKQFEAHLVDSALAPATIVNYLADLRAFLRWSEKQNGSGYSPFTLAATDVQSYCFYLEEVKGHTPATINRRIQTLRKFYELAIRKGWSPTNPAEHVPLLKEVVSDRSRSLTEDDIERLLDAVRGSDARWAARDLVIVQMLLRAGLKLGELAELQLADIHLEAGEPHLVVRAGAGDSDRVVPLDDRVCEAIGGYLPIRQAAPGVAHLCVNRDGNPLSTRSIQRLLRHYAQVVGLDGLTTQALRYAYAKKVYEESGDLNMVARLLGHRHLATTIRYLRPTLESEE